MRKSYLWPLLFIGGIAYLGKRISENAKAALKLKEEQIAVATDGGVYTPEARTLTAPSAEGLISPSGKLI